MKAPWRFYESRELWSGTYRLSPRKLHPIPKRASEFPIWALRKWVLFQVAALWSYMKATVLNSEIRVLVHEWWVRCVFLAQRRWGDSIPNLWHGLFFEWASFLDENTLLLFWISITPHGFFLALGSLFLRTACFHCFSSLEEGLRCPPCKFNNMSLDIGGLLT